MEVDGCKWEVVLPHLSFTFPQTVNAEGVPAKYDAGVLSIELAKKEAAKPKQVKIEVGSSNGVASQPKQVEVPPSKNECRT